MNEADLMRRLQVAACRDPMVRLFRNNNGEGWVGKDVTTRVQAELGLTVLKNARRIKFGLGTGTADLIGFVSIEITPEMVGKRVAVFAAPEVKRPKRRATAQQKTFLHVVNSLGGLAGIVRTEDDMREMLRLKP